MVFIPRWERFRDRMPQGAVEINWNNPLSNNLILLLVNDVELVSDRIISEANEVKGVNTNNLYGISSGTHTFTFTSEFSNYTALFRLRTNNYVSEFKNLALGRNNASSDAFTIKSTTTEKLESRINHSGFSIALSGSTDNIATAGVKASTTTVYTLNTSSSSGNSWSSNSSGTPISLKSITFTQSYLSHAIVSVFSKYLDHGITEELIQYPYQLVKQVPKIFILPSTSSTFSNTAMLLGVG